MTKRITQSHHCQKIKYMMGVFSFKDNIYCVSDVENLNWNGRVDSVEI